MFQLQQEKKAKKWKCKVCNSSQSIIKVYAISEDAKGFFCCSIFLFYIYIIDLRPIVQELNLKQGEIKNTDEGDSERIENDNFTSKEELTNEWGEFETEGVSNHENEEDIINGISVVTSEPQCMLLRPKRKREKNFEVDETNEDENSKLTRKSGVKKKKIISDLDTCVISLPEEVKLEINKNLEVNGKEWDEFL
jgi:hypothetical protein